MIKTLLPKWEEEFILYVAGNVTANIFRNVTGEEYFMTSFLFRRENMKKKLVSVLLVSAMAVTMLAGCGSTGDSDGGSTQSGSSSGGGGPPTAQDGAVKI